MILTSRAVSRLSRVSATSAKKATLPALSECGRFFLSTSASDAPKATLTRDDVVDSQGLLQFKTLHEMNHYASIAFKDNSLFGTYKAPEVEDNVVKDPSGELGKFEWMSYGEYGEMVDRCRTVLKDIGEFSVIKNCLVLFVRS